MDFKDSVTISDYVKKRYQICKGKSPMNASWKTGSHKSAFLVLINESPLLSLMTEVKPNAWYIYLSR